MQHILKGQRFWRTNGFNLIRAAALFLRKISLFLIIQNPRDLQWDFGEPSFEPLRPMGQSEAGLRRSATRLLRSRRWGSVYNLAAILLSSHRHLLSYPVNCKVRNLLSIHPEVEGLYPASLPSPRSLLFRTRDRNLSKLNCQANLILQPQCPPEIAFWQ